MLVTITAIAVVNPICLRGSISCEGLLPILDLSLLEVSMLFIDVNPC